MMIYCVEDDKSIGALMVYALKGAGIEAVNLLSGEELFEHLKKETPDLITLDVMLPGKDGIEILKELRANPITRDIPIIMASAKGTEFDKVIGLDLGADDYLAKPFGMTELVSRVKALLRRSKKESRISELSHGKIRLNKSEHKVYINDKKIDLTLKEYELLELFMENVKRVFTREELLERIWGMDYLGETRTVDVHIGTLRTKLGKEAIYIETVRGVGYRMRDIDE